MNNKELDEFEKELAEEVKFLREHGWQEIDNKWFHPEIIGENKEKGWTAENQEQAVLVQRCRLLRLAGWSQFIQITWSTFKGVKRRHEIALFQHPITFEVYNYFDAWDTYCGNKFPRIKQMEWLSKLAEGKLFPPIIETEWRKDETGLYLIWLEKPDGLRYYLRDE
jgi:hypothetical protein